MFININPISYILSIAVYWNIFVQLGMTDDSYKLESSENLRNRELVNRLLPYDDELSVELVVLSSFEHDETKNEMLHNKKNRHVNFFIVSLKKFVRSLRWANLIIDKLKSQQLT